MQKNNRHKKSEEYTANNNKKTIWSQSALARHLFSPIEAVNIFPYQEVIFKRKVMENITSIPFN